MRKLTRFLFGVADVSLAIMLLGGVATLILVFFAFLDLTFTGSSGMGRAFMIGVAALLGLPSVTALSYLLLVIAVLFVLGYLLSYFLLLTKQVLGLFMMMALDLAGLVVWQFDPAIMISAAVRWIVLGLPWLLTWIDLKRRGAIGPG